MELNRRQTALTGFLLEGGFAGEDRFYGNLAAVRQGKHIIVALGTVDEQTARKQLEQIADNFR